MARLGEQLPSDHPLVRKVISVYDDVVESGRLALHYPHLHIHGITLDADLHRSHVEEEITVVTVNLGHVHLILLSAAGKPLAHGHQVIHVPLLDLENGIQLVGVIYRVTGPGDVPEIVLAALVHIQVDSEPARLHIIYGVVHQTRVTVTRLIVCRYELLLVIRILLFTEFLGMKEVVNLAGLGLLHRLGQLELADVLRPAVEIDFTYPDLLSPVDYEIDPDGILDHGVLLDLGPHLRIHEALLLEIALDDVDGGLLDIFGELPSAAESRPFLDFLLLSALYPGIYPLGHAGTLLDLYAQPHRVPCRGKRIHLDGNVLEIPLLPEPVHDGRSLLTRNLQLHPLTQTRKLQNLVLSQIGIAFHLHAAEYIRLRMVIVHVELLLPALGICRQGRQEQKGRCKEYDYVEMSGHLVVLRMQI